MTDEQTPQPARKAAEYESLIVAWRNDAAVRLASVAATPSGDHEDPLTDRSPAPHPAAGT